MQLIEVVFSYFFPYVLNKSKYTYGKKKKKKLNGTERFKIFSKYPFLS